MNPYPYGAPSVQPMYPQPMGVYPPTANPMAYPQPVVQPVVQPAIQPGAIFGGMQFAYVQDPMAEIAQCPSILIRQEPEFLEGLTGCEQPNVYHVFGNSPLGMKYLFKCIEKSGWCMRRCFTSSQRSFDMDVIHCSSMAQLGMGYTAAFANFQKPFKCTMCCLCRPEINVSINGNGQPVGKIKHICTVCDPTFDVYNATTGLKYVVAADCCQCALWCPGFWAKTSRGVFEILDAGTKQRCGTITKESANMAELVTDADSYTVIFPNNADANDKFLLMGLAILIDYSFFETDANEDHEKRTRGRRTRKTRSNYY